nr:amidase family protein [Roseobacter ponti]
MQTELLVKAGFSLLGKTNVPEFGFNVVTEPVSTGPTRDPNDLSRSPGGSSGGSAAAVAAGIVPLAHAGDGAGSIRIPAAFCGLIGLKPSRGLMPIGPARSEVWEGAVVHHVITKTVRDSAAVLDHTAGASVGDLFANSCIPERGFLKSIDTPPEKLRVGTYTAHPFGGHVDAENVAAVELMAQTLDRLGHHVEPLNKPPDLGKMAASFETMASVHCKADLDRLSNSTPMAEAFEAGTLEMMRRGSGISAENYVFSMRILREEVRRYLNWFATYDVLLTPVSAIRRPLIGASLTSQNTLTDRSFFQRIFQEAAPFSFVANVTGQPSLALPALRSDPVASSGSILTAMPGRDDLLLAMAHQVETIA